MNTDTLQTPAGPPLAGLAPRVPSDDAIIGCILGTAVGDATGLYSEGLSRERQRKLQPRLDGPAFVRGRGMISDDTEHTCMVAQALIASAGDVRAFQRSLARQMRFWLLGLPAGTGKATLQAGVRLWLGFGPERSGVFSAGNGPAMRSALIGVCYAHDTRLMRDLVRTSTCLTHTDPKAEWGALAVALAAFMASAQAAVVPAAYCEALSRALDGAAGELLEAVHKAADGAATGRSVADFAAGLGLARGVSGYIYHTVPVALYAWMRYPHDYRTAVLELVRCGGDTDSTAAIAGGIIGAGCGREGIPAEWLDRLWEWPRTVSWMEALGRSLARVCATQTPLRPPALFAPAVFARNILFLLLCIGHALRRGLPPY